VSARGSDWYVVNATPDIRYQIESFPALHPGPGLRQTPLRGILLTDAELDHTIGLLVVREGAALEVYGTSVVLAALEGPFPVRHMLGPYSQSRWIEVRPNEPFLLDSDRLRVTPFRLGVKRPRYTAGTDIDGDWVVGYRFEDLETGGVATYAPGVEAWTPELDAALEGAACVFLDGTFWTEDEMVRAGASNMLAKQMGHIPVSGPGGSAERLAALAATRKIYVHVNNTNPMWSPMSDEHHLLAKLGIEVGHDHMDVEV
jgi:pyrroloquinoline quinone biosynthesis protein B